MSRDFHVHEVVDGLWSMTFMTTDEHLFFKVKETCVSLEPGTKQCTKVTNDCSRNMYGSNTSVAGQICEEITKKSSGNLIVFHIIIHQDTLHCHFFF